jgi:hypothetical protein
VDCETGNAFAAWRRTAIAEVFTRELEQHNGRMFNRWADVATIIGMLDSDHRHPPAHGRQHDIEAMLKRAVNEIGGA